MTVPTRTLTPDQFQVILSGLRDVLPSIQTPALVFHLPTIEHHAQILQAIEKSTGCRVLFAVKSFANRHVFPHIAKYVSGSCVTSINELRFVQAHFSGEIHAYRPAFSPDEIPEFAKSCDHLVVNSFSQWQRIRPIVDREATWRHAHIGVGIRINPERSVTGKEMEGLYNPCAEGSRLGVPQKAFKEAYARGEFDGLEGLHVHALCGNSAEDLAEIVAEVEANFKEVLTSGKVKWLNLGGGHAFSKIGYNLELLCKTIQHLQQTYGLLVYLEPGEYVTVDAGYYVTTVDDIVDYGGTPIGLIDGSADAHMHDSLFMPFRPEVIGAVDPDSSTYNTKTHPYIYTFGGNTCMSGDKVTGRFAFSEKLVQGQKLVFTSFAEYSAVMFSTFNGVPWPNYYTLDRQGILTLIRQARYEDYADRL